MTGAVAPVELGDHPWRAALEDVETLDPPGDLGHELDGARAGADDRDPPAGHVVRVIPVRGVEGGAGEALGPRDRGQRGTAQLAAGGDEDVDLHGLAGGGAQPPAPASRVEVRRGDLGAEAQMAVEPMPAHAVLEVAEDVGLRREAARPVALALEGVRVQVRGDVAGRARVGVLAPHSADPIRLLEDRELVEAVLLETDAHAHAGEAAADDRDARGAASALDP